MPTRLPFPLAGAAAASPAYDAGWESEHASFGRWKTMPGLEAGSLADFSRTGTVGVHQQIVGQWITDPLDVDQTIAGTFDLVVRAEESAAAANVEAALCIWVMKPDLSARGVLFAQADTVTGEFPPLDPATVIRAAGALASVNAVAGDRIVVESGLGSIALDETATIRFGAPTGVADFALTAGLTTDLRPWLEFSQTITFGAVAPPTDAPDLYLYPGELVDEDIVLSDPAIARGGGPAPIIADGSAWLETRASGDLAVTDPVILADGSAQLDARASALAELPLVAAGSARIEARASGSASLAVAATGAARLELRASGEAGAPPILAAGSVWLEIRTSGAASLPVAGTGSSRQEVRASAIAVLPLSATGSAEIRARATAVAVLPLAASGGVWSVLRASGAATVPITTAGSARLELRVGSFEAGAPALVAIGSARAEARASGSSGAALGAAGSIRLALRASAAGVLPLAASGGSRSDLQARGSGTFPATAAGSVRLELRPSGAVSTPLAAIARTWLELRATGVAGAYDPVLAAGSVWLDLRAAGFLRTIPPPLTILPDGAELEAASVGGGSFALPSSGAIAQRPSSAAGFSFPPDPEAGFR